MEINCFVSHFLDGTGISEFGDHLNSPFSLVRDDISWSNLKIVGEVYNLMLLL